MQLNPVQASDTLKIFIISHPPSSISSSVNMSHVPHLTTHANLSSTYNSTSARCCRMSYKVSHEGLQFSTRDAQGGTYHRKGDSTARDNWILGKGSVADGWDGWSLVQGESRYWESKLQKPEYRGKCGGAAANRLSEETIVKTLSKNANSDLVNLPPGKLVSEFLKEQRIAGNSKRADALHAELLCGASPTTSTKGAVGRHPVPSPPSPRHPSPTSPPKMATQQPIHNHAKDYWEAKNEAKQSEEQRKQHKFEMLMKQRAAKEQQKRKPLTRAILLASGNPIEGDSSVTKPPPTLPPLSSPSSPRAAGFRRS
jgi:hypothetical protein